MASERPTTPPPPPIGARLTSSLDPWGPWGWPRWVPIVLGAWLFVSAFLWHHSPSSATNSWVIGLLIAIAGLIALRMPWMRWVVTALAVWLFLSTLAIAEVNRGTPWNNLIVAVLVFLASLVPGGLVPTPPGPSPERS
ncbi:MAG TPA: SPW repeat protein [Kofleriaceae bacterium]|jgi:hypothetical protein|nr:SPW repeat protein [Kofleriaceae bacterium]